MRSARFAFVFASALVACAGSASAQQWHTLNGAPPQRPAPEPPAVREMRHRLLLVATRAIGYFMSADSIEASLRSQGLSLRPDIAVLRVRLEAALDQTEAAIDRGDLDAAGKSMDIAQALVDRFAAKLGG